MNQILKHNIFIDLGCKSMKDVIFQARNKVSVKDYTMQQLERMFNYLDWMDEKIYIEAIPERLAGYEISNERGDMIDGYKEHFPECFK